MSTDATPDEPFEIDPQVLADDLAAVRSTGAVLQGEAVQVGESTWAVYGQTTYDGEVIVAEYHDVVEARAVLRADRDGGAT